MTEAMAMWFCRAGRAMKWFLPWHKQNISHPANKGNLPMTMLWHRARSLHNQPADKRHLRTLEREYITFQTVASIKLEIMFIVLFGGFESLGLEPVSFPNIRSDLVPTTQWHGMPIKLVYRVQHGISGGASAVRGDVSGISQQYYNISFGMASIVIQRFFCVRLCRKTNHSLLHYHYIIIYHIWWCMWVLFVSFSNQQLNHGVKFGNQSEKWTAFSQWWVAVALFWFVTNPTNTNNILLLRVRDFWGSIVCSLPLSIFNSHARCGRINHRSRFDSHNESIRWRW